MKIPLNNRFIAQCEQFEFRFTCEYCFYFDPPRNQCLHEYPNEMHRTDYYFEEPQPADIVFCKQFELR